MSALACASTSISSGGGIDVLDIDVECCSPLVREPLSEPQAAELARVFKAVGDPVSLRLPSLIASHDGSEACVCDLTGAFEVVMA